MAAPEIKVKMGVEGTEQVVSALKKVQSGAEGIGKAGAGGFGKLTSSVSKLQSMLPGLSFTAIVGGITAAVTSVVNLADNLGDLSAQTGMSVENLSTMQIAAKRFGMGFEEVNKLTVGFAKSLVALKDGASGAAADYDKLGLSAKDFVGLSPDKAFQKVVDRLNAMGPSMEKTSAEMAILGKSGKDADEMISALADGGLESLKESARATGQLIGTDLADSADKLKKSIADLEAKATSAATAFTIGFAPELTKALNGVSAATAGPGGTGDAFKTFGKYAGIAIRGVTTGAVMLGEAISLVLGLCWDLITLDWGNMGARFEKFYNRVAAAARGEGAIDPMEFANRENKIAIQLQKDNEAKAKKDAEARKKVLSGGGGGGGGGGKSNAEREAEAIAKATLEIEKTLLANEVAALKANLALKSEAAKDAYEDGLLTLKEYYEKRRNFLNAEMGKELKALQAEYDAIAAQNPKSKSDTLKQENDLAKLEGKKAELLAKAELDNRKLIRDELEKTREIQKNLLELQEKTATEAGNELEARRLRNQIALEARRKEAIAAGMTPDQAQAEVDKLKINQTIQGENELMQIQMDLMSQNNELTGNTYANEIEAIERTIAEYRKKYSAIRDVGELEAELDRYRQAATANANYGKAQDDFSYALAQMNLEREKALSSSGLTIINEQRALEIQRQMIPILQAKAALLLAEAQATGDRNKLLEAQNAMLQVQQLQSSVAAAQNAFSGLKQGIFDAAQNSLAEFFATGISGAKSLGDAFRGLAVSVLSSIQQMIAKMLAMYLMQKLIGMIGGLAGGAAGGTGSWATSMGAIAMASGGLVRGPGTATSDSIPAWLSNGEYIINAASVRQPGMLAMLQQINQGASIRRPSYGFSRFAEGGLVGAGGTGESMPGRLDIGLDEGLFVRFMESPKGQKIFVQTAHRNRRAMKGAS